MFQRSFLVAFASFTFTLASTCVAADPDVLPTFDFTVPGSSLQMHPRFFSPFGHPKGPSIIPAIQNSNIVDEVMNLQYQSTNRLFQGLHEREQQLRGRYFAPEIIVWPQRLSGPLFFERPLRLPFRAPLELHERIFQLELKQKLRVKENRTNAAEYQRLFDKGEQAESAGKIGAARIYFRMVAKRATGTLRKAAQAKLVELNGTETPNQPADR